MCGIAGMVRFDGLRPGERTAGAVMAATLRHRGPDEAGHYADAFASLGHARLSIIDLADGRQPMSNEDGTVHVVFNGEIYNHRDLADRLRSRGHHLRTQCDTEVLAHLYEDEGDRFVEHLNGMFAIAIWDAARRRLVLARDRLGIKPLYYHHDGRSVRFGSELKALLAVNGIDREIDPAALCDYLTFGHVPAPRSIYKSIRKLEPGQRVSIDARRAAVRPYWDIPVGEPTEPAEDVATEERFADLLADAVRMRLMADVPLGAFLSGGLDSTAIVAAMRRVGAERILTHTVGFEEHACDEREHARAVARRLETDHRELVVRPDASSAAERLTRHFDEPFADSCGVAMLYLSQAARERVTVALSGDGADEMLAGYRRYAFDLAESEVRARCPAWLRRPTAGVAGWLYPKADWLPRPLRAKRTLQNLAVDDATAHLRSVAIEAGCLADVVLDPAMRRVAGDHDPFDRGRELFARASSAELLDRLLYVDMKTLLADDILTKVDRASMAVGLEVRTPLLDHRLVEFAARLPVSQKLGASGGKHVLRQVLRNWLGDRPAGRAKQGFDLPLDGWFRGPLRDMAHDLLLSPDRRSREWIDSRSVQRIVADHMHGLRSNGQVLWTLLSLELWAREYEADPARSGYLNHEQLDAKRVGACA